ncbi:hypothetical protein [Kineococcus sp. SYSU DK005]|uniref:hypothetical protein n=1 Tax=Kineococcus sp. SYSU DK005 TaxID=3383126 RepID=UPI003D7D8C7A
MTGSHALASAPPATVHTVDASHAHAQRADRARHRADRSGSRRRHDPHARCLLAGLRRAERSTRTGAAGPLVAFDAHSHHSTAALVGGTLTHDGHCLTLDAALPAVWPVGTTWDEQTSSVVLPEGTSTPVGTVLSAGGGVVPFTSSGWPHDQDAAAAIEQCLDPSGQVVSFNTGATPTSPPQPPAQPSGHPADCGTLGHFGAAGSVAYPC